MDQQQRELAIAVFTGLTALIHIGLGIGSLSSNAAQGIMFILNGVGYIGLVLALQYLPQFEENRSTVKNIFLIYTAVTIIGYFAINIAGSGLISTITYPVGMIDKIIEFILMYFLAQTSYS